MPLVGFAIRKPVVSRSQVNLFRPSQGPDVRINYGRPRLTVLEVGHDGCTHHILVIKRGDDRGDDTPVVARGGRLQARWAWSRRHRGCVLSSASPRLSPT